MARAALLSKLLWPTTREALRWANLQRGARGINHPISVLLRSLQCRWVESTVPPALLTYMMLVLDLGCGNGMASLGISEAIGRVGRVTAVDANPTAIDEAEKNVRHFFNEDSMARINFGQVELPNNMTAIEGKMFDLV